ncbi:hypothetical protein B0H34DRAFT_725766, partial [Crassisporium funariophilum]
MYCPHSPLKSSMYYILCLFPNLTKTLLVRISLESVDDNLLPICNKNRPCHNFSFLPPAGPPPSQPMFGIHVPPPPW